MKTTIQENELVSIILPTKNRSHLIEKSIASVIRQDYKYKELIIIDDGSNKEHYNRLLELLENYSEIILLRNKKSEGVGYSLNLGITNCKGNIIARIDDDDIWIDPLKLTKQVSKLSSDNIGLLGSAFTKFGQIHINPLEDESIRKQILFRCPFSHTSVIFRKDLWKKCKGYNKNLPYSEDWDLWLRMGRVCKMGNLEESTVLVADTLDSQTRKWATKQHSFNTNLIRNYLSYYPNSYKALIYNLAVSTIFKLIKFDGHLHNIFKRLFKLFFLFSKK